MAEKVCLDTDLCIAILNGETRAEMFRSVLTNSELFITSITVFELFLRKDNIARINDFLNNVYVLEFNEPSAIEASEIHKELQKKGRIMDFRDVFIASTAMVNKCSLATFNSKHFSKISNLKLIKI